MSEKKVEVILKDAKRTIKFWQYPDIPNILYFETDSKLIGHISMSDSDDSDIHFYVHDHATISCRGTHKANPLITIRRDEFATHFVDRTKESY